MSDIKTFVGNIIDGKYSIDELSAISIALKARRERAKYDNQANLRVGSKIKLHGLRSGWNDCEGEITEFSPRRTHVKLNITKIATNYKISTGVSHFRFPISCVTPLGTPVLVDDEVITNDAEALNAVQQFLGR